MASSGRGDLTWYSLKKTTKRMTRKFVLLILGMKKIVRMKTRLKQQNFVRRKRSKKKHLWQHWD